MSGIKPSTVVHPTVIEGATAYTILPMPVASDEEMGSKLSAQKNEWIKDTFKHASQNQLPSSYHMLFLDTVYVIRPANSTCVKLTGAVARQKRKDMRLALEERDVLKEAFN